MFSSRSVQIAAVFSDVFGQALPNLCRSFYNETKAEMFFSVFAVALLAEGVDRNIVQIVHLILEFGSPSSRRAWIEILIAVPSTFAILASPSSRRAWIEISVQRLQHSRRRSPSSRRAWIEIVFLPGFIEPDMSPSSRRAWIEIVDELAARLGKKSPSSRRAWIEIGRSGSRHSCGAGRPPRGGRG